MKPQQNKDTRQILDRLTKAKAQFAKFQETYQDIPKHDPWIPFKLGEDTLRLELNWAAANDIQRRFNKNVFNGEVTETELSDMSFLFGMLLAGLQTHQPEMTEDILAKKLTAKHRLYYVHSLMQCMEVIQPDMADIQELIGAMDGDAKDIETELEAGGDTAPLPEFEPFPTSGQPVE